MCQHCDSGLIVVLSIVLGFNPNKKVVLSNIQIHMKKLQISAKKNIIILLG